MTPRRLVVVVPAFNEVQSVGDTVAALHAAFPELQAMGLDCSVCIVDDGSSDGTATAAREAGAARVVRHRTNQGLGAAVRSGLRQARQDGAHFAVKFDADLQHDPADIATLVQPLLDDEADIVYGHRFNRIEYKMPLLRRLGNRFFTWLLRTLTGWPVRDSQPGILAVNASYLAVFRLPGDYNYTQQILLDAYHNGMRFTDRDVAFRPRLSGHSFVTLKYPLKVASQIFWVVVNARPMKIFGPLGLLFIAIAAGIAGTEIWAWWQGHSPKPIVHVNAVLGSMMLGLQTFFFGVLAELIIQSRNR